MKSTFDLLSVNDGETRSEIVAIGLWTDITVRLLKLPSFEEITKEALGGDIIPRSILMAQFEGEKFHPVWKFHDFSITHQILREIKFEDCRSAKSAIFLHIYML